ncbi:MAG: DMT family transporter [Thermoprotei archaeon]|nr:DMT family transporter [Thermoprotei archaeon]
MRSRRKGYLGILGTLILWSWAVIFIKILASYFDPITQNFYRYSSAALALTIISASLSNTRKHVRLKITWTLIVPAVMVFLYQIFTVYGIYMTEATIAALLMRTNVIFTNAMSFLLFEEERRLIGTRKFMLGLLIAFIGIIGVTLRDSHDIGALTIDLGALMVLLGTIFWASYTVSVKISLREADPLILTTIVFSLASLFFLPVTLLLGDIGLVMKVSPDVNLMLIGSGILCVGIGNFLNYIAIMELGVAVTASLQLMTPLLTGVFSYMVMGERLTEMDLLFGGLLLLGCGMIIRQTTLQEEGDYGD